MVNVVSGLAMVVLALLFWSQRDYTSQYGGIFPDLILILIVLLGLVLAALGALGRGPAERDDREPVPARGLLRATAVLVAWVATLPILGYLVGGIAFFFITALLMRKERPQIKGALLDLTVSVGVVLAFYLVFTQVLVVRLPQLTL